MYNQGMMRANFEICSACNTQLTNERRVEILTDRIDPNYTGPVIRRFFCSAGHAYAWQKMNSKLIETQGNSITPQNVQDDYCALEKLDLSTEEINDDE